MAQMDIPDFTRIRKASPVSRTGNSQKELMLSINLNEMPKLGFGLMRLPEADGKIDLNEVCRMVDMYMETGAEFHARGAAFFLASGSSSGSS